MRLLVEMSSGEINLPVHHNELIHGMIYEMISNLTMRHILHEEGFPLGQRRFKLFCFSRLMGACRFEKGRDEFIFGPDPTLVISSPISLLIQEIGMSLLQQGWIRLGSHRLGIKKVHVSDLQQRQSSLVATMISPVTVYSTEIRDGKKYTHYFRPGDLEFRELIKSNLEKKYYLVRGRHMDDCFQITPLKVEKSDRKVLKFKETWILSWMGQYLLEGDPDVLKVAYDAGLGVKNPQGFGCFEVASKFKTSVVCMRKKNDPS